VGYAWMPGASYLQASADGGRLRGGAPRAVWQALDTDPRLVSAKSAAQHLAQAGRPVHLVWNPLTGEIVQLISALRAGNGLGGPQGRDLAGPESIPGGHGAVTSPAGTEGRVCIQVAVVAFAREPFTDGPLRGAGQIIAWLDSWHVPRRWPAGPPSPFEQAHAGPRSRRLWADGGHFGASQVPACTSAGPGAIDIDRLTGTRSPAAIGGPEKALPRADAGTHWAAGLPAPAVRLAGAQVPSPATSPAASPAVSPAVSAAAAHAAIPAPAAASGAGSRAASAMR
jgi:hypothetical protein